MLQRLCKAGMMCNANVMLLLLKVNVINHYAVDSQPSVELPCVE